METAMIPPWSARKLKGNVKLVKNDNKLDQLYLCHQILRVSNKPTVQIKPGIVKPIDGIVEIHIMNPTPCNLKVYKNMTIGKLEPISKDRIFSISQIKDKKEDQMTADEQ